MAINNSQKEHFVEFNKVDAKYTLSDEDRVVDGKVYPSLFKLYLQSEDFTEYDFATKHFGAYQVWEKLLASWFFKPFIQRWRTELELKLKAEALQSIITEARLGGKNSYDAKKYILAKGWISKESEGSRRGRPSKNEILQEASRQAMANLHIDEMLNRIDEKGIKQ